MREEAGDGVRSSRIAERSPSSLGMPFDVFFSLKPV